MTALGAVVQAFGLLAVDALAAFVVVASLGIGFFAGRGGWLASLIAFLIAGVVAAALGAVSPALLVGAPVAGIVGALGQTARARLVR